MPNLLRKVRSQTHDGVALPRTSEGKAYGVGFHCESGEFMGPPIMVLHCAHVALGHATDDVMIDTTQNGTAIRVQICKQCRNLWNLKFPGGVPIP
jgi:hypothetical protein